MTGPEQPPHGRSEPQRTELGAEVRRGQDRSHPVRRRLAAFQVWSHQGSRLRRGLVVAVITVVGFVLLAAGVLMWFIPGPGWLFVFLGLGVWSLEFRWADRLNRWAFRYLRRSYAWWRRTRLVRWWTWCRSGAKAQARRAEEAAAAQRLGRPVRGGARNDVPGDG